MCFYFQYRTLFEKCTKVLKRKITFKDLTSNEGKFTYHFGKSIY